MGADDPAHETYEELADGLAERAGNRAVREAHGEWGAVAELLPPVDGRRVLDAACGTGAVARRLADRGAEVIGFDASARSVAAARRLAAGESDYLRADLTAPLPFGPSSFDAVTCLLALEHVADWRSVCAEFARVLRPGGTLLLSTDHPFTTYHVIDNEPSDVGSATATAADYGAVERYVREWGDAEMPCYRRPLEEVLAPPTEAGFRISGLREPAPPERTEHTAYFRDNTPRFVVVSATLPE